MDLIENIDLQLIYDNWKDHIKSQPFNSDNLRNWLKDNWSMIELNSGIAIPAKHIAEEAKQILEIWESAEMIRRSEYGTEWFPEYVLSV